MIEATTLSVSYDELEDRLLLDCADGKSRLRLILTRRITRRLLSGFADLLERSSIAVTRAPADMRTEVIAFEHLSAISQPRPAGGANQAAPILTALGSAVVAKVDVRTLPAAFRLLFFSATETVMGLTVSRGDFHRILGALDRYATAAEWDIRNGTEWMGGGQNVAWGRDAS